MKKVIIKIIVLAIAFAIGLIVISEINHKDTTKQTAQMSEATFPIVSMNLNGTTMNTLFGYGNKMQGNFMRDTIFPLSENREVSIEIKELSEKINSISYEIRSLDTTRLVEQTQIESFEEKNDKIFATLPIKNLLDKGSEYILEIILETETEKEIHYYTRIIYSDELHASEKIDFVLYFHNQTFLKDNNNITIYLESDTSGDNMSYQKVNIHSSFDQVTWGDLAIEKVSEPVPLVKEINKSTASVTLKYLVSTTNENGEKDYYHVNEFYRIRYTKDRMYLLDFERSMDQLFGYENQVFVGNKVLLGIVDPNMEYSGDNEGNIVCFVQGGELWSYNNTTGKLVSVFSFLGGSEYDIRNYNDQHGIKIISVDETGNIDFIVYGYMNKGIHEGIVGISIFHYDNAANAIEEKVFIPSGKSYQVLKEDLGKFSYVNEQGDAYLMINDGVYAVDLDTRDYEIIVSGLTEDSYVISDNSQMLAWQEEKQAYNSTSIHILDLETRSRYTVSCGEGERIVPLGFMDQDFIYGIARLDDISYDVAGNIIFPMYVLRIQDKNNQIVKEYQQDGVYISRVEIANNLINLKRITKGLDGNDYTGIVDDQIINNVVESTGKVTLSTASSQVRKKEAQLVLGSDVISESPRVLTAKVIVLEEDRELKLDESDDTARYYYVYAFGILDSIYADVGDAIERGIETSGVVVADSQKYVWESGNRQIAIQIDSIEEAVATENKSNLAVCLESMLASEGVQINVTPLLLNGETATGILESNLKYQVMDLTGCSLDAALYYVSRGIPVLAMLDSSSPVLIVGYDQFNTIIMNPATGTKYKIGLNDSEAAFSSAGNIFITYLK